MFDATAAVIDQAMSDLNGSKSCERRRREVRVTSTPRRAFRVQGSIGSTASNWSNQQRRRIASTA
jgi:hypothetical protein